MSFSLPKQVPSFQDPQRRLEDTVWGSSGAAHQRSSFANGVGEKIGGYFNEKQLPMYKDKPYSYATSGRNAPFWRRKRTLGGTILFFFGLLYLLGAFSTGSEGGKSRLPDVKGVKKTALDWITKGETKNIDWTARRERVKEAFILSWDSYSEHGWGYDEYHPVSKTGRQMASKGLGWIIVDALDTLMIMNLTSRLSHAREWVTTTLDYDQDQEVNTFETTIRMLGGLLSAHYLSTTFPDMAPLVDDNQNAASDDLKDIYLEKATDLADRLGGAYESISGVPYASVNLKTRKGIPSHADGGASSTAEASSLQLEMKYIAKLTGEKNYWDQAEKVMKVIDDNGAEDGLVPIFIYADSGLFRGRNIRLGSRGDSYYEYLIKQYLQTSKQEPVYLDMWNQALAGVRKHLITYSALSNITVLGELPDGIGEHLHPKMDHLVCFMPGTIALGATGGLPLDEARRTSAWGAKQESEIALAKELTQTCWGMYKVNPTGLAPEIAHFNIHSPPIMENEHVVAPLNHLDDDPDAAWRKDYDIKPNDVHNLQRPETVESLFYMWRITGDEQYRVWGWEMFKSFIEHTDIGSGAGFTSLDDVTHVPPRQRDNMESFWLAETLKYIYLLFSPNDLLPLDKTVINTEAHFFPRFELGKLFSTGWERKKRDKDGKIVSTSPIARHDELPMRTLATAHTESTTAV